jgi:probable rRNA maturation factor
VKARLHDRRCLPAPPPPAAWRKALTRLAEPAGAPAWPVDVVLVDDAEIAALNRRWRGCDEVTDVLSFSYLAAEGEGAPALRAGSRQAATGLWRDPGDAAAPTPVGELVIAPAFVARQCAAHGWDLATEWALLTVHGLLHLLGWTHGDPAGTAAMRSREAQLLLGAGFRHPLPAAGTGAEGSRKEEGADGSRDR